MSTTISERIRLLIDSLQMTPSDFNMSIGYSSHQKIYRVLKDPTANVGFETLTAILSKYPKLRADWLVMGIGPMWREGEAPKVHVVEEPNEDLPHVYAKQTTKNGVQRIEIIITMQK